MDDRLKKNPKNELLEDIRKIVKEEIEKTYIPYFIPHYERPYYTDDQYPFWRDVIVTWTANS